ncbi:hypothetical protein G5I_13051 [Acromyrmex echinatior]|uniref:Uncharacterized protein n=1 Tax=Acromyrmex echinatior TaxID=103372 RepID=F4X3Y8_ACREC|nr:hypothetical protein G5I_13051 [Acromyrmex echinatior]
MRYKHYGCSLIRYIHKPASRREHNCVLHSGDNGGDMVALLKAGFVVLDEFRSKVACENEVVNLVCHPGQRVAIFSAAFGRTQYESLQCPQPLGVQEENTSAKPFLLCRIFSNA